MQLFVDLDGVLVDFERGFHIIHGVHPHDVPEPTMWKMIVSRERHWHELPAMPGALMLWAKVAQYNPIILTGCPRSGFEAAAVGKREWCQRELGSHVQVITTYSRDKPQHMLAKGDILIDDLVKNCNRWTEAGGVAIQHSKAEDTIAQLEAMGL